ncbi:MAG TPA: adenylate/guanylate cyclase domain-containing protein [Candidatus Binatia bacterium]|jgi:adenylate cyclase
MIIRRVRLVSGLVLLTYLATHFINHALGLISLDAMEGGRSWFLALWRNPLATLLLYGALTTHLALAFYSLYRRRHLRMPLWEALQLVLGLTIPLFLAAHIAGTRVAHELFDVKDSYSLIVLSLWNVSPLNGIRQATLVVVAWIHGCIGLHFWLRLRPWYSRMVPIFFSIALLLPVLALLGFAEAGREISDLMARQPDWFNQTLLTANVPRGSERALLTDLQNWSLQTYVAILGLVLLARAIRQAIPRRDRICLTYPGDIQVAVPRGLTVLEASRFAGIPHTSVCGGRGRCSTCRVRVVRGWDLLPPARPAEIRLLKRVGAPPNVRLACQLRPTANLSITPLVPATGRARHGFSQPSYLAGEERNIVVLFADLRSFTGMAEHKLPYDLVFILNSYFKTAGEAVARAGGVIDKFVGDGVMALFGIETDADDGCRRALNAAHEMVNGVNQLSQLLAAELTQPMRIGVGIHSGPAVVGRMGYGSAVSLTAIGDTVNVASRLQELTKEYGCQLVISEEVAQHAGINVELFPRHDLTVRNRREALTIYVVKDVQTVVYKQTIK